MSCGGMLGEVTGIFHPELNAIEHSVVSKAFVPRSHNPMNPVDCFTKILDLMIVVLGVAALFAVPLRSHFAFDSASRWKLLQIEIMALVMVAFSIFGLVSGG